MRAVCAGLVVVLCVCCSPRAEAPRGAEAARVSPAPAVGSARGRVALAVGEARHRAAVRGALGAAAARVVLAPDGETAARSCLERAPEGMACIPAGAFVRGWDEDAHRCEQRFGRRLRKTPNARPSARVWLQAYYMDVYEVTVEAYRACIEAGGCSVRPDDGLWGPSYKDFSRARQPITGITWYQAVEYCGWRGKHLPSEAQWEKAARGAEGELHPWGNAPATCERAVIRDPELEHPRSCGVKKMGSEDVGRVLEVGTRPVGRYGLYDMIGNVEEWVFDWYTNSWEVCGEACLGVDPRGPCGGAEPCEGHAFKSVRGGSWYWGAEHGTGIHRRPHYPENSRVKKQFHHFGFRCAASLGEAAALVD